MKKEAKYKKDNILQQDRVLAVWAMDSLPEVFGWLY